MRHLTSLAVVLASGLVVACGDQQSPLAPALGGGPLFSAANAASVSSAPVLTFDDMTEVGASKIVRNADGVAVQLSTTGLEPGTAVTLWMIAFNNPENCTPPGCGEDDVAPGTAAMVDVINVTGSLVGGSGKATVAAHHRAGEVGYSVFNLLGAPAPGLIEPGSAEIHLVVRSHGQMIPGLAYEMTHTFAAGCSGFPAFFGTPEPNTCEDLQFAVHQP
jgi:hypothetical protein